MTDERKDAYTELLKDVRFAPVVIAAVFLGIIMLAWKDLPEALRVLPAALVVYGLGAGVLGMIHVLLSARRAGQPITTKQFKTVIVVHLLWFVMLIGFCFKRAVL